MVEMERGVKLTLVHYQGSKLGKVKVSPENQIYQLGVHRDLNGFVENSISVKIINHSKI